MCIRSFALAAAATATFAVPTVPAAAEEGSSASVQYRDLDLASEAGQKELERRLDKAARNVCGMDEASTGSRVRSKESRDCYRDARQQLGDQLARLIKGGVAG